MNEPTHKASKNIIVTGLSGLVGSALRREIEKGGGAESADLFEIGLETGVDLTDTDQTERAFDSAGPARAAIHLAAFTDVSAAWDQHGDRESLCWRVNVEGTANVARACASRGIHLIHISTDFVFDGASDETLTEASEPNPIEWYGETKFESEGRVREASSNDAGAAWTIIRIGFPYAAGPAPKADLIRKIHARLAGGEAAHLFDDQIITPTLTDDIGAALALLAEERPAGELFHICGSTSLSPFELGGKIAETFGFDAALVQANSLSEYMKQDPRPRQRCLRVSNAKWSAWAAEHGLPRPATITVGLERVRSRMPEN